MGIRCVGVNGKPCPGEKTGYPFDIDGLHYDLHLCRLCKPEFEKLITRKAVNENLVTPLRLRGPRASIAPTDVNIDESLLNTQADMFNSSQHGVDENDSGDDIEPAPEIETETRVNDAVTDDETEHQEPEPPPVVDNNSTAESEPRTDNAPMTPTENPETVDGDNASLHIAPNEKIVINELLFYCVNMLRVLEEETLLNLCVNHYSTESISAAKEEIFQYRKDASQRKIERRGPSKNKSNMLDIVMILRTLKREDHPVYVARYINSFPPLHADRIDLASLMADVNQLKRDLSTMNSMAETVKEIGVSVNEMKQNQIPQRPHTPPPPPQTHNQVGRGNSTSLNRRPSGQQNNTEHNMTGHNIDTRSSDEQRCEQIAQDFAQMNNPNHPVDDFVPQHGEHHEPDRNTAPPDQAAARGEQMTRQQIPVLNNMHTNRMSYSDLAARLAADDHNHPWQEVTSKKSLRNNKANTRVYGTGADDDIVGAAKPRSEYLYVGNVLPHVTTEMMEDYVWRRLRVESTFTQILSRNITDTNYFKVAVSPQHCEQLLKPELWSRNFEVRKWRRKIRRHPYVTPDRQRETSDNKRYSTYPYSYQNGDY